MKFSQRIGRRPIKTELEKEELSIELRNSLWTLVYELILNKLSNESNVDFSSGTESYSDLTVFFRELWMYFYKYPIDNLRIDYLSVDEEHATIKVRDWYYKAEWDLVFDFIEFCSSYHNKFQEFCNRILKQEMSAYRFIDSVLVEINSKEEVIELKSAIENVSKYSSVKEHLKRAVELYSDRKNPDYRNSIKESISAVESLAKLIIDNEKATLGQALKEIETKHKIPGSLKSAFSSLYGYTSDAGGIRHSLLEKGVKIEMEEARFMLIACSAFVNYLLSKI